MIDQNEPPRQTSFFDFKVALTLVAVALTPPKVNHFLIKHIWTLPENLKKIHPYTSVLCCCLTDGRADGQTPMIT